MYTIFMAVGPLLLIIVFNILVVRAVLKNGTSGELFLDFKISFSATYINNSNNNDSNNNNN